MEEDEEAALREAASLSPSVSTPTGRFYRSAGFQPRLILLQIFFVQCSFYALYALSLLFFFGVSGSAAPSWRSLFSTFGGPSPRLLAAAYLVTAPAVGGAVSYAVERARKCLDHCCTVAIFHAASVWLAGGRFPRGFLFWAALVAHTTAATLMAERLCAAVEMREIAVTKRSRARDVQLAAIPGGGRAQRQAPPAVARAGGAGGGSAAAFASGVGHGQQQKPPLPLTALGSAAGGPNTPRGGPGLFQHYRRGVSGRRHSNTPAPPPPPPAAGSGHPT